VLRTGSFLSLAVKTADSAEMVSLTVDAANGVSVSTEHGLFLGAVFSGFNSQNSKRLHTMYTCMERE
jgi:hypothetical protein